MVLTQPIAQHTLRQDLNRSFYAASVGHPFQAGIYAQSAFVPSVYGQPAGFYAPAASLYPSTWQQGQFMPKCNVADTPEATIVTIELPGVELNQVALRIEGSHLILDGVRHPGGLLGDRMMNYTATEGRFGAFRWICPIPNGTMAAGIEAVLRNGLLTIVLPRVAMHLNASPLVAQSAFNTAPVAQVAISAING